MKKKIILLPIIMLALAGCGEKKPSQSTDDKNSTPAVSTPTTSTPTTSTPSGDDSTSTPSEEVPSKVTIAEVVAEGLKLTAGSGKNAEETAKAYEFEGTVTGIYGNSYMLQQDNAGLMVYNKQTAGIAIGKKVNVVSTVMNYYGLVETKTITSATVVGDGAEITPMVVDSFTDIKTGVLVSVEGVKYTGNKGTNFYEVTLDGETSSIYVDKYLDSEVKTAIEGLFAGLKANDTINVVGGAGYSPAANTTNNRITVCSADQLVVVSGEPIRVESVTALTSVEVEVGRAASLDAKVLPENADDQELIYEVADPTIAEVTNGRVKGLVEGSTTITVKAHADETKTATVTVTVIAASGPVESKTATFTFEGALDAAEKGAKDLATSTAILGAIKTTGDVLPVSASNIAKIYAGANGGRDATQYINYDVLKIGTTKVVGTFDLTFADDIQISKVTVKMAGWASDSQLTINGVTNTCTKVMSIAAEFGEAEFVLNSETNVLSFSTEATTKPCVCLLEIAITYAN